MDTLHCTGPFFISDPSYFSLLIGLLMLCTKPILQLILRALTWGLQGLWLIYSHYK